MGSKATAVLMAFKLLQECQKTWRKIRGHEEIKNLLNGLEYKDGVVVANKKHRESAVCSSAHPQLFEITRDDHRYC